MPFPSGKLPKSHPFIEEKNGHSSLPNAFPKKSTKFNKFEANGA
jgi:hypothetical protein